MDMRIYYFKILITTGVGGGGGGVVNRTENIQQIHIYRNLRTLIFIFFGIDSSEIGNHFRQVDV